MSRSEEVEKSGLDQNFFFFFLDFWQRDEGET